jgi:hypothetical protein
MRRSRWEAMKMYLKINKVWTYDLILCDVNVAMCAHAHNRKYTTSNYTHMDMQKDKDLFFVKLSVEDTFYEYCKTAEEDMIHYNLECGTHFSSTLT